MSVRFGLCRGAPAVSLVLLRADDIRKGTGHSEAQLQELKHLANEADVATMLTRIKELIPEYTGWPRKSRIENRESKIENRESGIGNRESGSAEREEGGGEKSSEEAA